jgi:hypothetical protein
MRLPLLGLALLLLGALLFFGGRREDAAQPDDAARASPLEASHPVLMSTPAPKRQPPVWAPAPAERPAAPAPAAAPARPPKRGDAVLLGLEWLAANQEEDGSWDPVGYAQRCPTARPDSQRSGSGGPHDVGLAEHRVAVTAFALLAYLGAGYTNRGDHAFAGVVRRGFQWLKGVQRGGLFTTHGHAAWAFDHAVATLAMTEIYGMTESWLYRDPAQQSLDALARLRGRDVWAYDATHGLEDESLTLWALLPLGVAQAILRDEARRGKPGSLSVDEAALQAGLAWAERLTDLSTAERGAPLSARGHPALPGSGGRSVEALAWLARELLSTPAPRDDPAQVRLRSWVQEHVPASAAGEDDGDALFRWAGTHVAFAASGEPWKAWEAALQRDVFPAQGAGSDPCLGAGSWAGSGAIGRLGGRVLATALGILCFEHVYRYDRVTLIGR